MLVSDFNFYLPEELIAQEPLPARDSSRMLHLRRKTGEYYDRHFRDLPDLLRPDDVIVFNNTRVFPARLYGRRAGLRAQPISRRNPAARDFLHGRVEVLLTRQLSNEPNDWQCLVRPGRKIGVGERLLFGEDDELRAEVIARGKFGERQIRFRPVDNFQPANFYDVLDRVGHVPLPPYIARPDSASDRQRYQTIYAQARGSVAAPTAGLHFTPQILDRIRQRGMHTVDITLHVGLGTFQPIHVERVEDHKIHSEAYSISPVAAHTINQALRNSRRIVAIGTTTVRTLEHAIRVGAGQIEQGSNQRSSVGAGSIEAGSTKEGAMSESPIRVAEGTADLFMYPGFEFKIVGAMLTNFHLPQSTLLMLVSAFAGRENVLRAYQHAVAARYRFYSYGDCMFID
ncbi:MAG: tRNA preQ1(34) S-adenosylmethionine ribosyltransferase-isomerase QueA [Candidatus Sulfotelmatobacter sp.]